VTNYSPIVILSHPQLPENIGAVARAMGNFNLIELRLINPCVPATHPAAIAMSAGAENILNNASVFNSLKDALFDIEYAFATSIRKRYMEKEVISAHHLRVHENIKTAFVFGSERTGLHNEEIVLCQKIISIDVNENFSSLNLAQAAIIIFHEWFKTQNTQYARKPINQACTFEYKAYFLNTLEELLDNIEFWRVDSKKEKMWHNIQNIFTKNNYTKQDMQTLTGILKDIQKRLS
jgi:tRNA/rRNA methyltransferase